MNIEKLLAELEAACHVDFGAGRREIAKGIVEAHVVGYLEARAVAAVEAFAAKVEAKVGRSRRASRL